MAAKAIPKKKSQCRPARRSPAIQSQNKRAAVDLCPLRLLDYFSVLSLCRLLFLSLSTAPGYDRSTPEEAAWMGLSRHKQARTRSCCVWRCRRPFRHPLTHALHRVRVLFSESSIRHSSFESGAQTLANENDHGWIFQKHLQIYVCPLM